MNAAAGRPSATGVGPASPGIRSAAGMSSPTPGLRRGRMPGWRGLPGRCRMPDLGRSPDGSVSPGIGIILMVRRRGREVPHLRISISAPRPVERVRVRMIPRSTRCRRSKVVGAAWWKSRRVAHLLSAREPPRCCETASPVIHGKTARTSVPVRQVASPPPAEAAYASPPRCVTDQCRD